MRQRLDPRRGPATLARPETMNDLAQTAIWTGILAFGVGFCVLIRKAGVPTTYVRDFLHVGAGIWPFGWPFWRSAWVPCSIAVAVTALTVLAPRVKAFARFRDSVAGGDERWSGLVLYGLSFATLTVAGFAVAPFPAAAALMALSLGDGIGGAVGRRFGRHHFTIPGSKRKSVEGSLAVAAMASLAVAIASAWFGAGMDGWTLLLSGLVAAAAEALAPQAKDNAAVPLAVWLLLTLRTGTLGS
jgi:phytol kinase